MRTILLIVAIAGFSSLSKGDTAPKCVQLRLNQAAQLENSPIIDLANEEVKICVETCQAFLGPGPELKACVTKCYQ